MYVEAGQVNKNELAHNFSLIYKTNRPWQIRMLDDWTFLVKFPPHIPVESVARYPLFGLTELHGVIVNVEVWKGTLEHHSELQKVWLQLDGVAPAWAEWAVLKQFASVFGTLIDVDWLGNFKSFFEVVRIKIKCKDHTKIPPERLFGIGDNLFRIGIIVEPQEEDPEMDDLLGDELTDNANGNKLEQNKKEEEKNNREKENTGGGSTTSLQSSKSASSKQKVSEYLKQLQDPVSMEQSYNILQGMELDEDEDEIEDLLTEDGVNLAGDEGEVIFSPQLNPGKTLNSQLSQGETEALPVTKEGKSKWGPVQASRKSNRVEVGGRTMMEIAINTKKVQNLEVSKGETKGGRGACGCGETTAMFINWKTSSFVPVILAA